MYIFTSGSHLFDYPIYTIIIIYRYVLTEIFTYSPQPILMENYFNVYHLIIIIYYTCKYYTSFYIFSNNHKTLYYHIKIYQKGIKTVTKNIFFHLHNNQNSSKIYTFPFITLNRIHNN